MISCIGLGTGFGLGLSFFLFIYLFIWGPGLTWVGFLGMAGSTVVGDSYITCHVTWVVVLLKQYPIIFKKNFALWINLF